MQANARRLRVKVDEGQLPCKVKPDAGPLAPGIPPSNFWTSDPIGLNQVGCVYTAQGFEFDYVGLMWGRDLRLDPATSEWIGDPSHSHDSIVKRSGDRFTDLVKRTYRVLLTHGLGLLPALRRSCHTLARERTTAIPDGNA